MADDAPEKRTDDSRLAQRHLAVEHLKTVAPDGITCTVCGTKRWELTDDDLVARFDVDREGRSAVPHG